MPKNKVTRSRKKLQALRTKPEKQTSREKKVDALVDSAKRLCHSDPKKAIGYVKQSLALAKKLNYTKGIANSYLTMAACTRGVSEYTQAIEHSKKAIKLYAKIGEHKGRANCYMNIGIVFTERGGYKKALDYYIKALAIFEEIGDNKGITDALNNMGVLSSRLNDLEQGTEYFLQALSLYESINNKTGIAATCLNVGANYYEMGDPDQALRHFLKGLRIFAAINDKKGCALSYLNLGEFYEKCNDPKVAVEYLSKALKMFEKIEDTRGVASSTGVLGRVYAELHNYDAALSNLNNSLQFAREVGVKDVEIEALKNLAKLHEVQHEFKQALGYYRKYHKLTQEVFNAEKNKQITAMRTRYETEKKEKEAELFQLKNVKLRKEIRQRKAVERELKEHRNHLEKLVEERTADLRSLAHELSLVEEKQRRKIATYLHDDISQTLALATVKLELLHEETSITQIKRAIEEIKEVIDETNLRTRSLTFEISPPVLYDLGLEPALEWFMEQFSEKHGIKCDFNSDGLPKPMSNDTKVILFQSVRELLTNVAKHAQARSVRISTLRDNNTIRIQVEDDGVGFDHSILEQKTTKNEGFGLFNLKERLRHLRGKLEVASKIGQGTSVALVAPLEPSRRVKRSKQ